MGRKQLWDQAEVLASAMRLFRHRGYLGASLRDIEEATGLHPGSLYRTFESKEGLFRAALDAYNDQVVQGRVRVHLLESADPVAGIRSFFTSAFETGLDPDPGCLLTNTAVESFTVPQAAAGVRRGLETIESGFADALTRARTLGLLSADLDVEVSAARLLALYQGLLVLVRAGTPITKLHTITDGAMASIGSKEEGQR
ncbi:MULTISPECIES: TetR/AcrR family transcriptional regulator [unclassified Streptomyces]|uniref:TetR/AcrR family transcriptional regulator n=1 Tax=unclassified Streptomyces TaxID=2593676 RepID=UPI001BE8DB82|nr:MULTISPECIES: TetR/AcrR family transcriptional regulator [unclassified Streptomyces]MBT2408122.1 TetR/AcrR family transcriptional regulator [Streptomyces sp. ISL-21]MBT2454807.1 TetR/AcrR family transcriptional regulator [Streptomyces sp. ISL-86]MBT2613332.1 TetR/AcrR family transcriptional regulator [Streptomyces sp. ISL-87]